MVLKSGEALYQSGRRVSVPKTMLHTLFQKLFDVKTPLPLGHKMWDTYISRLMGYGEKGLRG